MRGLLLLALVAGAAAGTWTKLCPTCSGFPTIGRHYVTTGQYNSTLITVSGNEPGTGTLKDDMFMYDAASNTWSSTCDSCTPRPDPFDAAQQTMPLINGKLWLYGGKLSGKPSDILWSFDPVAQKWTKECPGKCGGTRPAARSETVAASYGKYFFIYGGGTSAGGYKMKDVWRYDTVANTWKAICGTCKIKVGSHMPGTAVIGNKWYMYGGSYLGTYSSTLTVYNMELDSFSEVGTSTTPGGRNQFGSMVAMGKHLYLYGGFDGTNILGGLWRYDTECNVWSKMVEGSGGPGVLLGSSMAGFNTTLYLLWGSDKSGAKNEVWKYDTKDDPASTCDMVCRCMPASGSSSSKGDCGEPTCATAASSGKLSSFKAPTGTMAFDMEFGSRSWSWMNSTHAMSGDWKCWKA